MANEAVKIVQGNISPRRMTCASGVAITKNTLLSLYDAVTVSGASLNLVPFAGIATSEKSASDGSTSIGVDFSGIYDLTVDPGSTIAIGSLVCLSGANLIRSAVALDILSGAVIGKALETGSANEVIAVQVGSLV